MNDEPGRDRDTRTSRGERPIAVDLFAGAGGLGLGFEQAGFDIVASVEYDPIHAAINELNFPYGTTICRDIQEVTGPGIREAASLGRRVIDVVVGGPPCQGFSLIGHRVLEDLRNALVFHFLRLVSELRPRVFVMENVPGMATGQHTQLLQELIDGFGEAGYRVRLPYRLLNAAHYGVPQDRRRLFLLGARPDTRLPDYPQPKTLLRGYTRNGNGSGELELSFDLNPCPSVADAIGDLPDVEKYPELLSSDELRIRLRGGSHYAQMLRGGVNDPEDFSYPRVHDSETLTGCRRAGHTELSRSRFAATTPGSTEPVSHFYRLPAEGVCNTLRAGTATDRGAFTAPRPIHPTFARCITVREAARLHSYPDWYRFHRTIWHGFRQIGNSVPPLLGRAVAGAVAAGLGVKPARPAKEIPLGAERLATFDMREAAAYFDVHHLVVAPRRRRAVGEGR